jgi:hypothetical protein
LEYTERLTFERGNRADTLVGFAEVKLYFQWKMSI